jgi:short subunit dehydrogenase-like uncharacterized protein
MATESRQYELILYGATGYTGKFTAEYLHKNAPTDLKWAIAGRNLQKLENLLVDLKSMDQDRKLPGKKINPATVGIVEYNGSLEVLSPESFLQR